MLTFILVILFYTATAEPDAKRSSIHAIPKTDVEYTRPNNLKIGSTLDKKDNNLPETDKRFFFVHRALEFKEAQLFCQRKGAVLAMIHSVEEQVRVGKVCQDDCWLGLDRGNSNDTFGWTDNSPLTYQNWVANEPSKGLCAYMVSRPEKNWMSASCDTKLPFVCQNSQWHFQMLEKDLDKETFALDTPPALIEGNVLSLGFCAVAVMIVALLGWNYVSAFTRYRTCKKNQKALLSECNPGRNTGFAAVKAGAAAGSLRAKKLYYVFSCVGLVSFSVWATAGFYAACVYVLTLVF